MSDFLGGDALPSGVGHKLLFGSAVRAIANNNESQQFTLSGNPSGDGFTLAFGGDTTADIPAIPSLPYANLLVSTTLAPGSYNFATNIPKSSGDGELDVQYQIYDGSTLILTSHLNHGGDSGFGGGVTNPTPFADTSSPTPLQQRGSGSGNGVTIQWYPLATNLTLTTGALSIRVSGSNTFPGRDQFGLDNIRIVPSVGGTVQFLTTVAVVGSPNNDGYFTPTSGYQVFPEPDASNMLVGTSSGNVLRYLVNAATTQTAFQALASVGSGNATMTGDGSSQTPIVIQYAGSLAGAAQSLPVASDPTNVHVSRITAGGVLPLLHKNSDSPVSVPGSWILWDQIGGQMPTISIYPPVCPDTTVYRGVGQYYNSIDTSRPAPFSNGSDGSWQIVGGGLYNLTYATTGSTPTATWDYGPWKGSTVAVSATWTTAGGQSTAVTYTVKDRAGNVLGTHTVNQTAAPSGDTDQGVQWEVLGSYTTTGESAGLTVVMSNGTSSTMVANAIRFHRTSSDDTFRVSNTDTVGITWGAGWLTTLSGGPVAAQSSPFILRNIVGGQLVPVVTGTHQCEIGYNTSAPLPSNSSPLYLDLVSMTTDIGDAWPTTLPASPHDFGVNNAPPSYDSDAKAWPNIPPGNYILLWVGAADAGIVSSGTALTEDMSQLIWPGTSGSQNQRVYNLGGDPLRAGAEIKVRVFGTTIVGSGPTWNTDVTDVHIYPLGTNLTSPPKYEPSYIARGAGMQSRRFLDPLGTIDSNPTDYGDYQPAQSRIGKTFEVRNVQSGIASIQDYTGTMWNLDRSRGPIFLLTTTAPHSFANNQHFYFSGDCNAVGSMHDSVTGSTISYTFANGNFFVYVVDSTSFVFQSFYAGLNFDGSALLTDVHMVGTITAPTGIVFLFNVGSGQPLQDLVELCNANGENFYFTTSHTSTLAALESCATYIAENLNPGLKLRVECMNESWNFQSPVFGISTANSFVFGYGGSRDDGPYKCHLANQQWPAMKAAWVAAGRAGGDFRRVMGSQWGDPGRTGILAQYCVDNGLDFGDEVAIAPYLNCQPSWTRNGQFEANSADLLGRLTVEQSLDQNEVYFLYGGYELDIPAHLGQVNPHFPDVTCIFYEYSPQNQNPDGTNGPQRNHAIVRHPRWLAIDQYIMSVYIGSGLKALHRFIETGTDNPQGYVWAVWNYPGQLPYTQSTEQDAFQINAYDDMTTLQSVMGASMNATAARFDSTPSSLSGGTLTAVSTTSTTATCSIAGTSGGVSPYSNQLQTSPHGANTWTNNGSAVAGPSATLTATGLTASTAYDLRVMSHDSGISTVTSNTVTETTGSGSSSPATYSRKRFTPMRRHRSARR